MLERTRAEAQKRRVTAVYKKHGSKSGGCGKRLEKGLPSSFSSMPILREPVACGHLLHQLVPKHGPLESPHIHPPLAHRAAPTDRGLFHGSDNIAGHVHRAWLSGHLRKRSMSQLRVTTEPFGL